MNVKEFTEHHVGVDSSRAIRTAQCGDLSRGNVVTHKQAPHYPPHRLVDRLREKR